MLFFLIGSRHGLRIFLKAALKAAPTNQTELATLEKQCSIRSCRSQGFLLFFQNVNVLGRALSFLWKSLPSMCFKSWAIKQIWSYWLNCSLWSFGIQAPCPWRLNCWRMWQKNVTIVECKGFLLGHSRWCWEKNVLCPCWRQTRRREK